MNGPHGRASVVSIVEALRDAALRLPDAPDAHLFLEDRLAVRVESGPRREAESASMRTVGACARGKRFLHATDPGTEGLGALAEATGGGLELPPLPAGESLREIIPRPELPVREWLELARRLSDGGVTCRISGFHQIIWVAGPVGEVAQDQRSTARLELRRPDGGSRFPIRRVLREGPIDAPAVAATLDELSVRTRIATPIDDASRRGPVVFAPGVAGMVAHELVGHALEGDRDPHKTALGSVGERVGREDLHVIDDPRLGRAAWTLDDEGVAAEAVLLIDGGRTAGTLHDRGSARRAGVRSNGHGRRGSFLDPVRPRMGCTYIDRGGDDPTAIVAETSRGVYVRALEGGHADPCSGRATFLVTDADAIEDGRTTRPLRPFLLVLDAIDALRSIDRIGSDLEFDSCIGSCIRDGQPLVVSVGAPTVRLGVIHTII